MEEKNAIQKFTQAFRNDFWFGDNWSEILGTVIAWSFNWFLFLVPAYLMFLAVKYLVQTIGSM